jgi:hypothetical protein
VKACEVPGCGRLVRSDVLFCSAHWRRVPLLLKAAVNAAWANRRAALGGPHYADAVAHHEAVKRDAVAAVAGRPEVTG